MASSSTVGTAVIKLSFDGSDVKAELSKTSSQFKDAGEKAGSTFGSALTVAMGSLISKGVSKVISSITSNLDSAINRVDVVNNFPKVMESLGFSTDEAAASIKVISDRLDGLPSTLNGVVGDVQKLTATMGNLNNGMVNATSLGLALNDMFLAGGKGTEAASNAMEQYNQMLAQGKPDMQSWRSILNAAPGQLKQLANSLLGATANQNDLYVALQKGNVTFDQLNEAIVRLDQQGGDGFDSFERQARNATGGVGTALENVQNRISKAIAKVIDVIGSENIANAINSISSHFNDIGVEVGKFVKYAMTQIGEFTRFISNNLWIVDSIKGALVTIISLEIGSKIIELQKKVGKLFEFLSAHPLIALASAIFGIASAIESATSRETDLTKAMRETKEECDKATQSWAELNQRRQETLDKGMSELAYYENLKKELGEITDENGNVNKGYEDRAQFITTKLSQALGVEIQLHDGVIDGYKELQTEIDKTIEKKKAELKLKAQEEAYTQAIKGRLEASKRMAKIEQEIRDAQADGSVEAIKSIVELAKSYEEQEKLVGEYSAAIKGYESDLTLFTSGEYEKMSGAAWNWVDDLQAVEKADEATLQQGIRDTETSLRTNKYLYEKYGDEVYRTEMQKDTERLQLLVTHLGKYNTSTSDALTKNRSAWGTALNYVTSQVRAKGGDMVAAGRNLVNSLATGESSVSENAMNVIRNVAGRLPGFVSGQNGNMWNAGAGAMNSLANGISAAAVNVINEVSRVVSSIAGFGVEFNMSGGMRRYPAMASGGYVNGATTALVGEAGQEVVLPLQNNTNNWSGLLASAIMEQMDMEQRSSTINVYMTNNIDNDMSIDELGRKFSQSIRRYA